MIFLSLSNSCTMIFDRLELPETECIDIVWQKYLLPALQEGLLHAEGARADYVRHSERLDQWERVWDDLLIEQEWPMANISRDWWFTAAPKRLLGDAHTIVRDGVNGRVEAIRHIVIRHLEIDKLWPPPLTIKSTYEEAAAIARDHAFRKKEDVKLLMKSRLGNRYTYKIAEDAWRERMPSDAKPKGGAPRKPSH